MIPDHVTVSYVIQNRHLAIRTAHPPLFNLHGEGFKAVKRVARPSHSVSVAKGTLNLQPCQNKA